MPQTFFKNLMRSHGLPVTVEYQFDDETSVSIVSKWPHTDEYNRLSAERRNLEAGVWYGETREKLEELDSLIKDLEDGCLTDEWVSRIEQWLSEEHTQVPDIAF